MWQNEHGFTSCRSGARMIRGEAWHDPIIGDKEYDGA
jgi:hypothetical protein